MNWILYGFKGCGKSYFASKLGLPFLDLDTLIEEHEGLSIQKIILQKGEPYFRAIERNLTSSLNVKSHVIALGGGTVCDPVNLTHLRSIGTLIYLKCPKSVLKKRLLTPPLPTFISSEDDFERIYSQRIPLYEKIADSVIEMENKTEQEIFDTLWQAINLETFFGLPHGENPMAKPSAL